MGREYLKKRWRKLDNMSKIFSLDGKDNINIFRYSVILKRKVDKNVLMKALKKSLDVYSLFKVKMRVGLFWNYLEFNAKEPIVTKEEGIPCEHIDFKQNNDYLFKVTYYKKKINLDVFHVLTDGTGAISFFKSIIFNYLDLKKELVVDNESINSIKDSNLDQYLVHYDKTFDEKMSFKSAYLFTEKIIKNTNNTYHYIVDINAIKKVCKKYKVTITEYLTALYIYSIYLSIYNKKSNKEIVISIPIDLRKYYKVETLANFFTVMNINPKIVKKNLNSFEDILREVHKEFSKNLSEEKVRKYLARDVKLGMNIGIRLVPLFIKKLVMKYVGILFNKSVTSTLSNVGIIDIDNKYKKYIDNVMVLVMPGRFQKIKCTVCSFGNKLNVTLNSNIDDISFQKMFFKLLKEQVNSFKLESNVGVDFGR